MKTKLSSVYSYPETSRSCVSNKDPLGDDPWWEYGSNGASVQRTTMQHVRYQGDGYFRNRIGLSFNHTFAYEGYLEDLRYDKSLLNKGLISEDQFTEKYKEGADQNDVDKINHTFGIDLVVLDDGRLGYYEKGKNEWARVDGMNVLINNANFVEIGDGQANGGTSASCPNCSPGGPADATVYGWSFAGFVAGGKGVKNIFSDEIVRQGIINNKAAGIDAPVNGIKVPKSLKFVGKFGGTAFTAWGAYDIEQQFKNGEINSYWRNAEQIANGAGAIPVFGTGVTIGWELGRFITQMKWYQQAVHGKWYPPTIDDCITCPK